MNNNKESEFINIIKNNEAAIFKITTFYTNSKDDQEDLYQEIVFQLWKSFSNFRGDAKIRTWLYRIALNTAITYLKKTKKQGDRVSIDHILLKQMESYDSLHEDRLRLMYRHINLLNKLEKGLILLLLEGKKYEEIAEITGLTATNVGTRISRIKDKLKNQLKTK
mgnify:FL=1